MSSFRLTTFLLIAFAIGLQGHADVYRVIGKGNTIAPLRSSEIAMDAETVLVAPEKRFGGFHVSATFTLRNTTKDPVACEVAFPFDSAGSARNAKESFEVTLGEGAAAIRVNEIQLKLRDEHQPPTSAHDFPAALTWSVTWNPGETKIIRLEYDMGEPEDFHGFVSGWRVRYIVRTGALWKGPIGRAEITIGVGTHPIFGPDFARSDDTHACINPPFSYPANATRISPTAVTWTFENWTPDEDIWLGMIRWVGFGPDHANRIFIRLPTPYAGADSDYDDALLESVVDRELAPWQAQFPEQAKRDRPALKRLVAAWLYHEILARNGDSFYLGDHREGQPAPPEAYEENGAYFSIWQERFPSVDHVKFPGWYRPGTGKGPHGTVRLSDLTEKERRNLAFLRPHFALEDRSNGTP